MMSARLHGPFLACVLLIAGCAESRQLMPTPNFYTDEKATLFEALPQEYASTLVELIYVTDRAPETDEAGNLSYGHQRLLEIAMGLVQKPRLLILDEPTQGLADGEIEAFKTLIRDLSREATILLIEHNMRVVMDVADTITVLNFGETLAEGTPEEIRANGDVQAAYLGTGADA